jgi:choice-of-anchor C domain-containing protein
MGASTTMRRTSRRVISIMASVGLLAGMLAISSGSAYAAGPSVISNGSFETGIAPGVFTTLTAGDNSSIPGWTVSSGTIDYIGSYWTASDGSRSIDLSGNGPGGISQTFATIAGVTYNVTFDLSGNPAGPPAVKTMTVDAGGAPSTYTYDTVAAGNTLANMKWAAQTYSFTATSASTTLTFTSTTATAYGPALDDVRVVAATPTAKDDCKNGGWQHLTDGQGHTFKNQGDCVSFVATKGKNLGDVTP